jgi:hypothetical protein
VQYVKSPLGGSVPVALGVDHPGMRAETTLTEDQRATIADDLASDTETV